MSTPHAGPNGPAYRDTSLGTSALVPDPRRRRRQGRPSKGHGEDLAEQLLLESTALFRTVGFHAASVSDIVDASGVTRPTLYRHFGSKEGLALACVLSDGARDLAEFVGAAGKGTPISRLWAIAEWHACRLGALTYRRPLTTRALHDYPDAHHHIHRAARLRIAEWIAEMATLFEGLPSRPASDAAEQFLILVLGSGEAALATDPRSVSERFLDAMDDLLARLGRSAVAS
jgi:AcrR family transcriptional regulator